MGKNGGEWRGNNGTGACVGGYKNRVVGYAIETILTENNVWIMWYKKKASEDALWLLMFKLDKVY